MGMVELPPDVVRLMVMDGCLTTNMPIQSGTIVSTNKQENKDRMIEILQNPEKEYQKLHPRQPPKEFPNYFKPGTKEPREEIQRAIKAIENASMNQPVMVQIKTWDELARPTLARR